jgi:hypothetical protein
MDTDYAKQKENPYVIEEKVYYQNARFGGDGEQSAYTSINITSTSMLACGCH